MTVPCLAGELTITPKDVDKGGLLKQALEVSRPDFVLVLGDDNSDEPAFAALNEWQKSEERLQKFIESKIRQRNRSWQIDYEDDVEELEDRFQELHNDTTRMLSAIESGSNIF